jgi:hypothetical protein
MAGRPAAGWWEPTQSILTAMAIVMGFLFELISRRFQRPITRPGQPRH